MSRVAAIERAIETVLNDDHARPPLISNATIAAAAALSQSQVIHTIVLRPYLRNAIRAANTNRGRHLALWAARKCEAEGLALSVKAILRRGGITPNKSNWAKVKEVLAEIQKRGSSALEKMPKTREMGVESLLNFGVLERKRAS
jgi:hypothetical protein